MRNRYRADVLVGGLRLIPLTWGTRGPAVPYISFIGSSPHRRGTRQRLGRIRPIRPVHPRIRGEHRLLADERERLNGSSPHTRGTRLIFVPPKLPHPVHPRIRGEHATCHHSWVVRSGSSPHTRGTPQIPHRLTPSTRFIPAYAGNTSTRVHSVVVQPVHPRIRGEHRALLSSTAHNLGSSPHTRGTLLERLHVPITQRFIPAYAGNTLLIRSPLYSWPVHPRIRGEHKIDGYGLSQSNGSSPHTRGTLPLMICAITYSRFIPAYAGNTFASVLTDRSLNGSSPHTRGTHYLEGKK